MKSACIDYESKLLESRSKIIQSEATGESWLQNYVLVPFFRVPSAILDDHIWSLMEMGVDGYVAGRSLEKNQ